MYMSQVIIKFRLNFHNFYNFYNWVPHEMMSEKQAQKFCTDDASLPRYEGIVLLIGWDKFPRQHNQSRALGSDVSSVWNFCINFSDVNLQGIQRWHWEMSGFFLGCVLVTSIKWTHLLWDPRVSIKWRFISLVR